jgi:hypothetical protein
MSEGFINKILIVLLSAILIISFFIPYSFVFNAENNIENQNWENSYIVDDIKLITLYTAFSIFWLAYLLLNKSLVKTILKLILLIISLLFFVMALANLVFIAQDFLPSMGIYISIFIFPLLILF